MSAAFFVLSSEKKKKRKATKNAFVGSQLQMKRKYWSVSVTVVQLYLGNYMWNKCFSALT